MISINELRQVPIFSGLSKDELNALIPHFREKKFPKNSVIFQQDEEGDTFLFILNGRVKVVIMSRDGREVN